MGIELKAILQHSLDLPQITNLPTSLNEYFTHHATQVQVRKHHGYSGELVEGDNDDWVWMPNVDSYWLDLTGRFDDNALWAWGWKPDRDEPFEQWFQTHLNYGYLHLTGPYGFDLHVGASALLLGTDIKWHHFLFDEVVQRDVRRFCLTLCGFFGGSSAIYISDDLPIEYTEPENLIYTGGSYDQILSLLRELELPKASIREMIRTEYWGTIRGWGARGCYIDDFTNVAQASNEGTDTMAHSGAV